MVRILQVNADSDPLVPVDIGRADLASTDVAPTCRAIIDAVRSSGDAAVLEFTRKYDGVDVARIGLQVAPAEFAAAERQIDPAVRTALSQAITNIRTLHTAQKPHPLQLVEIAPGVWGGDRFTPIDSVCLYVPRGRGAFASVMCMLGVPAVLADVPNVRVFTPPGPDGEVDAATLVAAGLIGIDQVFRVGGAQAVAAAAFGTETIPRCAKFVGPGNIYVSCARELLRDRIDPGPPAGPSESAILCDGSAPAANAAWNLLIEAEHGENSCAILITDQAEYAGQVAAQVEALLPQLTPQRRDYAGHVLAERGGIIVTDTLDTAIDVVNAFAPEHLAVMVRRPWDVLNRIRHAGEVLIGDYPIISLGNYALGVNAILPTGGRAATRPCVSIDDFLKRSSVGYVSRAGFDALAPIVSTLSRDEGFCAHHLAVENWQDPEENPAP